MWGWISYDPDLDLSTTARRIPGPWNSNQRPGDNLWTTTLFARDPDNGDAHWAYPLNPHDLWDHDEINENVLLDLTVDGKTRKVLLHLGRNGYMYVIDRQTGEVLSADPYDSMNAYNGVDLKTGRLCSKPGAEARRSSDTVANICPASPGAKDWQPTAWSPRTGLLYVPHQHLCMDLDRPRSATSPARLSSARRSTCMPVPAAIAASSWPGTLSSGRRSGQSTRTSRYGAVRLSRRATSPSTARWIAGSKRSTPRTASRLWQFHAGSEIIGQPVSYQGCDGAQYVAIMAGVGGWAGAIANAQTCAGAQRGPGLYRRNAGSSDLHARGRRAACLRSSEAGSRAEVEPVRGRAMPTRPAVALVLLVVSQHALAQAGPSAPPGPAGNAQSNALAPNPERDAAGCSGAYVGLRQSDPEGSGLELFHPGGVAFDPQIENPLARDPRTALRGMEASTRSTAAAAMPRTPVAAWDPRLVWGCSPTGRRRRTSS